MKNTGLLRLLNGSLFLGVLMISACEKEEIKIPENKNEYIEGAVWIAKWKNDKKAVVMLEFDDSTPGQATLGVPALNSRNMKGTWYVNPGREEFQSNINTWENIAPAGGQELANHTMTHTGASTYEEVVYEVGDAAKKIWEIRGEEMYGSLMAFNRGGGTSWNEEDLAKVLVDFYNIDRESKIGVPVTALTVLPGSNAETMYSIVPQAVADGNIARLHFHGITATNGNPPKDYGNGAVLINELESFLDNLNSKKDEIWIGGFIQVYKYIMEKKASTISLFKGSETQYTIELQTELDVKYYNEPLTVIACLPLDWTSCKISYNGNQKNCEIKDGFLIFEVEPDAGSISVVKN
ncbi:MAG: polysaccharide deacetylase family protein [Bacteroidales bacterium]